MAKDLKKVKKGLIKASQLHKRQAKVVDKYIKKTAKKKNLQKKRGKKS